MFLSASSGRARGQRFATRVAPLPFTDPAVLSLTMDPLALGVCHKDHRVENVLRRRDAMSTRQANVPTLQL